MMMGYGVPQSFPGQMYMMPPAGHDSHMASLSNRMPRPTNSVTGESNVSGVMPKASSVAGGQTVTASRDAAAGQSFTAALGGPTAGVGAGAGKSKQGLEKILDTLSKMFPDVRRLVSSDDSVLIITYVPLPRGSDAFTLLVKLSVCLL